MSIKSILCIFGGSQRELNALDTALMLGKAVEAHIRILHISSDPTSYAGLYGEGMMATAAIIEATRKENEARLGQAKQHAVSFTAKHHIPLDAPESPAHHASARFVRRTGYVNSIIAQEGRLSDLIVMGRGISEPNVLYDEAVVAALFETGRPVMLLPQKPGPESYKTVALAWKKSREAAMAMYHAMPFLEKAEKVYILTAEESGETYDLAAEADLMEYLRAHGVHAQGIIVATGNRTPAEALLLRARELGADLLVMGAYGHSRFREMILGGVTSHMLEKADIPLLLSH